MQSKILLQCNSVKLFPPSGSLPQSYKILTGKGPVIQVDFEKFALFGQLSAVKINDMCIRLDMNDQI